MKTPMQEYERCTNDIVYFAEKYIAIKTDDGFQQVKLRDYQKGLLRDFQNESELILKPRRNYKG